MHLANAGALCLLLTVSCSAVADVGTVDHAPQIIAPELGDARAELLDLSSWLEAHAPAREAHGAPWKWAPENHALLKSELDAIAPYFDRLTAYLTGPVAVAALETTPSRNCIPSLGRTRNQVNLICGRAVLDARAGDLQHALQRLVEAHELIALHRDNSEIGLLMSASFHAILLDALSAVAKESCN